MTIDDLKSLTRQNMLTLVDFYAEWCGPCKSMRGTLQQLEHLMGKRLQILKLDIDEPSNREIVRQFNILSVPTLVLFKSGDVLWRESGAMSLQRLTDICNKFDRESVKC